MTSSLLSYLPLVGRVPPVGRSGGGATRAGMKIPELQVHHVETDSSRRCRCLRYLLRANHATNGVVLGQTGSLGDNSVCTLTNDSPRALCAAYLLGAGEEQLRAIYEAVPKESWIPSPGEVTEDDWRDYLADGRYQRGFVDFFDESLAMDCSYDWKELVERFLLSGETPLLNGLIGRRADALVHLGYAFEMDCKELATEALTLVAIGYDYLHKYLDDRSYSTPSARPSTSVLQLLNRLRADEQLDGVVWSDTDPVDSPFARHETLMMEYWNAWDIQDARTQFRECQEAAVALLVGSAVPGSHRHEAFLCHLLAVSHAVRVLLSVLPPDVHDSLVRQWWLLAIAVYISLSRPSIERTRTDPSQAETKSWTWVEKSALNSAWATDGPYLQAIRAMREAGRTWGDPDGQYLAAAVKFVDNFDGWTAQ